MSYIVLARRYRPRTFGEIIGQPHITTTLKNAILQKRLAHAYLFAGPRGVGKTTTARILAKAVNCEKAPAREPCNSCSSCNEITQGRSLDVLEIDGASNRGIDEIRNLRENVKFLPTKGAFKIYIIDEVHMLTAEAFNALLKTLEEPPPHVKFIFATTQLHKVPLTILSRCQKFDFRRIPTKEIFDNLKRIANEEKMAISDEALLMIAKCADGSIRDGQVTLDQIMSFAKGRADVADVESVLGIIEDDIVFGLADNIRKRDPSSALVTIDRLINDGKDIVQIILSLIEHFRNLSVVKISGGSNTLVDAVPDKLKRYGEQAREFTIEEILYITYTLTNALDQMRRTRLGRVPFEMAMVKLTKMGTMTSLANLADKVAALAAGTKTEDPPPPPPKEKAKEDPPPSSSAALALDEILSSWSSVVNYIRSKKISIASYLQEGYPISLKNRTLSIGFPKELQLHKEVLESPENRRLVEGAIKDVLKADLRVSLTLVEPVNMPKQPAVKIPDNGSDQATESGPAAAYPAKDEEPIIDAALKIFGGEISKRKEQ